MIDVHIYKVIQHEQLWEIMYCKLLEKCYNFKKFITYN